MYMRAHMQFPDYLKGELPTFPVIDLCCSNYSAVFHQDVIDFHSNQWWAPFVLYNPHYSSLMQQWFGALHKHPWPWPERTHVARTDGASIFKLLWASLMSPSKAVWLRLAQASTAVFKENPPSHADDQHAPGPAPSAPVSRVPQMTKAWIRKWPWSTLPANEYPLVLYTPRRCAALQIRARMGNLVVPPGQPFAGSPGEVTMRRCLNHLLAATPNRSQPTPVYVAVDSLAARWIEGLSNSAASVAPYASFSPVLTVPRSWRAQWTKEDNVVDAVTEILMLAQCDAGLVTTSLSTFGYMAAALSQSAVNVFRVGGKTQGVPCPRLQHREPTYRMRTRFPFSGAKCLHRQLNELPGLDELHE